MAPARPGIILKLADLFPRVNPNTDYYKWLVMAAVMIATFMAVLDATIVNVALSKLMSTFGVSVDRVEWVLTAYLLIFGVMLPSSGWFADHFGHKRLFLISLLLFTVGSFLCSLAWSLSALIFFRLIQGAGAGILMPVGMAIITREFPPEKRGIALGFWSISASASVSLGPTLGGYLIDRFSWHTIFDINVPVGIIAIIATIIIVREHKSEDVRTFDLLGFISLAAFLTALLLALSNGNSAWNTGGWTSPYILTCFAVALVGLVIFLTTEMSVKHPLIEIGLFKNFDFALSNSAMFLFGLGMFGSTFLLPIYLQNSLGYTPLQAGMVFLPVGILQGLSAPFAGYFADRYNAKVPAVIGLVLMAITFFQYSTLSYLTESSAIMLPLYLRGFAMGLIFSPITTMAIMEIPNSKIAQASGLINVIRQVGGSFGVATFGTLLTRRTIFHAAVYGEQLNSGSDTFKQTIAHLQHYAINASGGTIGQSAAKAQALIYSFVEKQAFIQGIDDVFYVAGITILISIIPVAVLRVHKRNRGGLGPKPMAAD
jgi:MFS transporter, DHA2 family, multidrug resistance protein